MRCATARNAIMETHVVITALCVGMVAALFGAPPAARAIHTNEHLDLPFKPLIVQRSNEESAWAGSLASPHIVGGNEASLNSYPHQVVLIVRTITDGGTKRKQICGGSLLTESWVITAAYCVDARVLFKNNSEKNTLTITAGVGVHSMYGLYSSKVQLINASQIIIHPEWSSFPINNDIALIKLEKSVNLDGKYAKTIRLPIPSHPTELYTGSPVTMIGWGTTNAKNKVNDKLHGVDSIVVGNLYCKLRYLFLLVKDTNICASGRAGKGTCQGDRGGPLIVKEADGEPTLIGIISFGFGCKWWFPNVFTRVTSYLEWIYKTTGIATRT